MNGLPQGWNVAASLRITGMSAPDFKSFLDSVGFVTEMKTSHRGFFDGAKITSPEDGRIIGYMYPACAKVPVTVDLKADQLSATDFEKIMAMIEAING